MPVTTFGSRGVSPVIGVVLMISITVILAAVLGTLVMDFTGLVEPEVDAGATVTQESSGEVIVTYTSEGTSDHILVRGDCPTSPVQIDKVGDTASLSCNMSDTVSVIAVHDSGTESLVTTHTVE